MSGTIEKDVRTIVDLCQLARKLGGISGYDAIDGAPVPKDWKLDPVTHYWLPPNVALMKGLNHG